MSRSENLPVLPQAVSAILKLADDPNASQRDLEKAFEKDPAITAKILRVANSAYYGGNQVPSIGRAISMLGITTIRSLVVGVAFQQVVSSKNSSRLFNKLDYWTHSLSVAVTSRIIGKLKLPSRSEELYCAGMMHDIGYLVLERFMPSELDKALEDAKKSGGSLVSCEQSVIGFTHAEVGAMLAEKWGLSEVIKNAIKFHHDPSADSSCRETTEIIATANELAYQCGYRNQGYGPDALSDKLKEAIGIPDEQIAIILQVLDQEIRKAQESFQIAA
ncbi:MAG: HDOD domain-containing protein [Armatimonadetes bacterium]|nr:HDOD domain-containing protein [Armatimonadota bacterium]